MTFVERMKSAFDKVIKSNPVDWQLSRAIRELASEYPQASILLMDELSRWVTNPELRKRHASQAAFLLDLAARLDRVALGIRRAVSAVVSTTTDEVHDATSADASTASDHLRGTTSADASTASDASTTVTSEAVSTTADTTARRVTGTTSADASAAPDQTTNGGAR